ncbi:MAG: GldM family protein [Bacteroidales bacterium]|nr:GldM family protein [Bacteroidales bacterium]
MNIKSSISVSLVMILLFSSYLSINAQCNDELVDKAISKSGMDALFIREFKIKQGFEKRKKKDKRVTSIAKYNVRLHDGILYRFNLENDLQSETKAILQLRKGNLLFASTYDVEKQEDIKSFDYLCPEGGQYQVLLSFLDGNKGCAVGVMSVVINDSTATGALADSIKNENILYAGVDNYIDIASSTNPNGTLKVAIDRGIIEPEGGLYRVFVEEEGTVNVNVTALDSLGQVTETFKTEFVVQKRSMPTVSFLGSSGGLIRKDEILHTMPYLSLNNWRWSDSYRIKMFTVAESIISTGISAVGTNMLSTRQLNIIKDLKAGETFYIKDIVVEDKNGQVFNLPPLGFIISE